MVQQEWILGQPVETQTVEEWVLGQPYIVKEVEPAPPAGSWFLLAAKNELQGIRGING